jgi:pimeloyl-ACP methyl ester carboxylesterase
VDFHFKFEDMERKVNTGWINLYGLRILVGVWVIALVAGGCQKDDSKPVVNEYLVDFEQESLLLIQSIEALFSPLESQYPEAAGIKEHAVYSVQIVSITCKTKYKGSEINASGLVCLPLDGSEFPIISFQNGTNTLEDYAPTSAPLNTNYLLLEAMASNGYIILLPDYIGFGASSDLVHPYYQKESTCSSIIDMMHACRELLQDGTILAKSNGDYYLMGYSQGGWATLALLEELEKNGPADILVSAASCGAGAYDLIAMSDYVLGQETFPGPLYLPYFIYSEQVYGSLTDPLNKFFNQPYAGIIPELFDGTYSNSEVNAHLNDTISRLLTADLIENFSGPDFQLLREVLTDNSVFAWQADARLHFYHGTSDLNVPPEQSRDIYNGFIDAGTDPARVNLFEMDTLTHETGVITWGISTINWFNELEDN